MEKLAINGDTPVRDSYLSYGRQTITEEDIAAVTDVLRGDFLTTGPTVLAFEKKVANYVGTKYAVAVSSATAALHMAVFAAGVTEGDEVLVPAMTFAASANCVLYCGASPVFVDIDPLTYNMDLKDLESKITDKTRAIIPVDFSGQSVQIDKIMELARKYHLIVIEDAAHALGSEYKGHKVGSDADMVEFSFHPVKPITTGEGGVVVTNNEEFYHKMMLFRSHGISHDREEMTRDDGPWYMEQLFLGYNYRLTDIQAALGISQMDKLNKFVIRRRELVARYNKLLSNVHELRTPYEAVESRSGWHIYVIRLNLDKLVVSRKEIFEALRAENIGVNVHYLPVYLHPYYNKLGYKEGIAPEAEQMYKEIITLPLFPSMTDSDQDDVVKAINKVISYYKK